MALNSPDGPRAVRRAQAVGEPPLPAGLNTAEKWSEDVSAEVAHELRRRCDLQLRDVPFYLEEFVERYEGRYHDIQLSLPIRLV